MKICVLGLDGAIPEVIFGDERLVNIRRLMDLGVYGLLESGVSPQPVPAWICMSTSQKPRSDGDANSDSIQVSTIWDQLAREGKKSIIVGVPPHYPPRQINGISIGCFLTPDSVNRDFTHPPEIKSKINELVGDYPVDVKNLDDGHKDSLREQILSMSRKQWEVVRWLLSEQKWDYFHFVDIGLDRMYKVFSTEVGEKHAQFKPDSPYQNVIPDYYARLDEQIGTVLELLDSETMVLLLSPYAAQDAQYGMFVLFAPNCPLSGEYQGARLLDIAPTLLDLAGYEIPETMQGKSLVAGMEKKTPDAGPDQSEAEKIIHDRLAGLGYV
jgi:predicted AlkP superfamily phosphohydrolase/phosphomutase